MNLLLSCSQVLPKEKLVILLEKLNNLPKSVTIRIITTEKCSIFEENSVAKYIEAVYGDDDEWTLWRKIGDSVLHIDLTKWADVLVVAPLDLQTLAKIAIGICDNLLTCTLRAWNPNKPVFFCPLLSASDRRLNIFQLHISILNSWGYKEVSPSSHPSNEEALQMADPKEITKSLILWIKSEKQGYILKQWN